MFAALKQFFLAISAYFTALEKTGNAAVNIATWADEASGAFADKARAEREAQLVEFQHMHEQRMKQLSAQGKKQIAAPAP